MERKKSLFTLGPWQSAALFVLFVIVMGYTVEFYDSKKKGERGAILSDLRLTMESNAIDRLPAMTTTLDEAEVKFFRSKMLGCIKEEARFRALRLVLESAEEAAAVDALAEEFISNCLEQFLQEAESVEDYKDRYRIAMAVNSGLPVETQR